MACSPAASSIVRCPGWLATAVMSTRSIQGFKRAGGRHRGVLARHSERGGADAGWAAFTGDRDRCPAEGYPVAVAVATDVASHWDAARKQQHPGPAAPQNRRSGMRDEAVPIAAAPA